MKRERLVLTRLVHMPCRHHNSMLQAYWLQGFPEMDCSALLLKLSKDGVGPEQAALVVAFVWAHCSHISKKTFRVPCTVTPIVSCHGTVACKPDSLVLVWCRCSMKTCQGPSAKSWSQCSGRANRYSSSESTATCCLSDGTVMHYYTVLCHLSSDRVVDDVRRSCFNMFCQTLRCWLVHDKTPL